MEQLSIQDASTPPPHGPSNQAAPPIPQLPPQMFTTAASLLDLTDKKLMVALRGGRKLIGVLRSWDQFGNLLLQDTTERLFVLAAHIYADISRGVYLVRGENILLMGEIDLDRDDYVPPPFQAAPVAEVHAAMRREEQERKRKEKARRKVLHGIGFEGENVGEALF